MYFTKSTITNDCHSWESRKEMWTTSPEPYPGACDRMEHFLPQVEYVFAKETGIDTMTADDSWQGTSLSTTRPRLAPGGALRRGEEIHRRQSEDQNILDSQGRLASKTVGALAGSGKLQYWQFLLALVLGLGVARRSAGLLEARANERRDLPAFERAQAIAPQSEEPHNNDLQPTRQARIVRRRG